MDITSIKHIFKLALRSGEILLINGATTALIENTMKQIANAYGISQCHPNATYTFLSLSLDTPGLEYPLTEIRRVNRRAVNYRKLLDVVALLDRACQVQTDPERVLEQIEEIERTPNPPEWISLVSWACACAALTLLLGGNTIEIFASFLIVIPVQFCKKLISEKTISAPFGDLIAAALVTCITLLLSKSNLAIRTDLVITGSLFSLLPGAAIVSSAQDLIGGNLLSSAARGLEGLLTGAAIAAGVGLSLGALTHLGIASEVHHAQTTSWIWIEQIIAAFSASLCYAVANKIPRSAFIFAGLIGACGWITALLIPQSIGSELFLATFLATLVVGCASRTIAKIQHVPANLYTIPGIFPFLPGNTLYKGMLAIAQGHTVPGLIALIEAVASAGIIAMGISLSTLLEPLLNMLHQTSKIDQK